MGGSGSSAHVDHHNVATDPQSPDSTTHAKRPRDIAAAVDPNLRVDHVEGVVDALDQERVGFRLMTAGIIATTTVLLLSAAASTR